MFPSYFDVEKMVPSYFEDEKHCQSYFEGKTVASGSLLFGD